MSEDRNSLVNTAVINKVINTIDENKMLNKGDKVIVALSGGPDSICLLHILNTLKEKYDLNIYSAHINHMLRGEESDKDEEVCREFCKENDIEFFSKSVDIEKVAEEKGISTEMAGREARYEFFEEVLKKVGGNKVAVAHNLNDQAETVLMRLMRGTGIEGLVGIKPVRDEIYIRPIINVTRHEIEMYCELNKLPARIDKSNLEPIYSRNKVRLELIPYIENNFNSDITNTLSRMCELIKRDEDFIQENVTKLFKKLCDISEEKVIIYSDAFNLHPALLSRIIRKALLEVKGDINNIQSIHIDNIIKVQGSPTGKYTIVPKEILVTNVYGNIEITKKLKKSNFENNVFKECIELKIGENYIKGLGINVTIKLISDCRLMNLKNKNNTKYFNIDGVNKISVRNRRDGDRFTPLGMKGSKKLKDILIDLKIPREERDIIPLICFDEDISWIVGYKISDKYKVHEGAKNIIEVKVERQEKYE